MKTPRPLTLLLLAVFASAGEAAPLTLAEAVAASQAGHPDAEVSQARVSEAQARLRQAQAALLPRLSVSSGYTVTDQPAMAFMGLINHGAYQPTIDANQPPTVDNLNVAATVQVPLYAPGAWSGRTAAAQGALAARHGQEAARQALAFATVQAFIGVHQGRAHVAAATAAVAAAEANLATARTRHQTGSLSKADLLGLEAHLAGMRGRQAAAEGGLDLAGQALAAALGREGSLTALAEMPEVAAPDLDRPGDKPELAAARAQVAAAEAAASAAEAQHLPRFGAFGGVGYDRGFKQSGEGQSWHAGLGVEWNLFAGGGTAAGVAEAEARHGAARAGLRRTALAIAQGRAAARTRLATATSQLAAVAAQRTAAEEAERLQSERFAAGAATASDLAAAESALAQARAAVADAEAGRRLAIAELRWQYGQPILP